MKSNEERIKECLQRHEDLLQSFVDKGELILSVRVTTKEQADELVAWLYSPEKPMKSELLEVSWDEVRTSRSIVGQGLGAKKAGRTFGAAD